MPSIEHLVFVSLAIWMLLKLTGVLSFIEKVWLYREAKRSAEKLARYVLNNGSENELRGLIKDQRNVLSDETITLIIDRLDDLAQEKAQAAKNQQLLQRGRAN